MSSISIFFSIFHLSNIVASIYRVAVIKNNSNNTSLGPGGGRQISGLPESGSLHDSQGIPALGDS